jgi:hypothetical protein
MITVPGATPSSGSSPTTPVVETVISAVNIAAAPRAISTAHSSLNIDGARTPKCRRFTAI